MRAEGGHSQPWPLHSALHCTGRHSERKQWRLKTSNEIEGIEVKILQLSQNNSPVFL